MTIQILEVKDIVNLYKTPKSRVYEILNIRGCPLIKGGKGKHYLIEKSAFEEWIRNINK